MPSTLNTPCASRSSSGIRTFGLAKVASHRVCIWIVHGWLPAADWIVSFSQCGLKSAASRDDLDARVLALEELQDLVGLLVAALAAPPREADLALDLAERRGRRRVQILCADDGGQHRADGGDCTRDAPIC